MADVDMKRSIGGGRAVNVPQTGTVLPAAAWPRGLFICGTDTGVGKTVVSALLLALLREDGIPAAPMKPVETGCPRRSGRRVAGDLERCLRAAGLRPAAGERAWMAPYRFPVPASPHLAARLAGRRISPNVICRAFDRLAQRYRPVLVEGAGGLMVPLRGHWLILDLIARLDVPVLLAARSGLGSINHTLLTLAALKERGLTVAGVIFNDGPDDDPRVAADNIRCIPRLGDTVCLGRIPYCRGVDPLLRRAGRQPAVLETLIPGRRRWLRKVLHHVA